MASGRSGNGDAVTPVKAIYQSSSLLGKAFMRGLVETVGTWPLENPWPYLPLVRKSKERQQRAQRVIERLEVRARSVGLTIQQDAERVFVLWG